jgi:hypothetical protein
MDSFTHQGEYISNLTDKLSGGITDCPMAIAEVDLGLDIPTPERANDKNSKPRNYVPVLYDRVAEAARHSRYFMGRRPRPIRSVREVRITPEQYRTGGSALYKFLHYLSGAIYLSSRRN